MRVLRFERRILLAILGVGFVSVFASVLLGRVALKDTYEVGVNRRIGDQLERSLDLHRRHLILLRRETERTAEFIAKDEALLSALGGEEGPSVGAALSTLLANYPSVLMLAVLDETGDEVASRRSAGPSAEGIRRFRFRRPLTGAPGNHALVLTATTPVAPFEEYRAAGEMTETYRRLEESAEDLSIRYLAVYFLLVFAVIAFALVLGVVVSRRVIRRVADLVVVTKLVGTGDLSVHLVPGAHDEIAELTQAFNSMVTDLRNSRDRIEYLQRIGAWQEFARRLAHEIKNPLTPIQLAVQEMEKSYRGDDETHAQALAEARGIVEEEVTTLRRLVGEFSRFAKLPEAQLSPADLNEFVEDLASLAPGVGKDLSGDRPFRLDVIVTSAPDPVPVNVDAMMLKRCADNLLRNAAQAIRDEDRDEGTVWVTVRSDDERVVLEMYDDGPGIPPEVRSQVFDPYYTTRGSGTGLGLAIVKKVILEHRGEIDCDVGPKGGARFTMCFPRWTGTVSLESRAIEK